jgi:hypothetical protein
MESNGRASRQRGSDLHQNIAQPLVDFRWNLLGKPDPAIAADPDFRAGHVVFHQTAGEVPQHTAAHPALNRHATTVSKGDDGVGEQAGEKSHEGWSAMMSDAEIKDTGSGPAIKFVCRSRLNLSRNLAKIRTDY